MQRNVIDRDTGELNMTNGYDVSDQDRYTRNISNSAVDVIYEDRIKRNKKGTATIYRGRVRVNADLVEVTTETGSGDDINTILGGEIGDRVTLMSSSDGESITIKDATGNIYLPADFTLNSQRDKITLIKAKPNEWHQESAANNS